MGHSQRLRLLLHGKPYTQQTNARVVTCVASMQQCTSKTAGLHLLRSIDFEAFVEHKAISAQVPVELHKCTTVQHKTAC